MGASLHRTLVEGSSTDGGWQDRAAYGGNSPGRGGKSLPCKSVPALRLRHVDGAGVSRHSVREVRGRSHLPLPKRRRGEGTMERFGGPLRGLQAGAAPAEDKARLLQGCKPEGRPSKSSNAPLTRQAFNCSHGDGSSNEPSLGSIETAA